MPVVIDELISNCLCIENCEYKQALSSTNLLLLHSYYYYKLFVIFGFSNYETFFVYRIAEVIVELMFNVL